MHTSIREIDAATLAAWLEEGREDLCLLDVREMGEIAGGTVPGARPLPLATLPLRLAELDPRRTVVVVCRSGARSAQACLFLQAHGFPRVYNLRGGMLAWVGAGRRPVLPEAV